MRLCKIHIENFGKLHDLTLSFPEDLTVFVQQNGWGKSTLAAFVKVMFYGFANEKKRGDVLERERVRHKPWQGGVYGGELEFETGGRRYLLNRTFGAKDTEDTFTLYDASTNLESADFSENIGEELFQINRDSFLRTIYIAQNDCATSTTDSINAKMGNLADNLDDINNYEKVQEKLKDLKNRLAPTRKTGALKQLKEQMDELKNELRKQGALEKSVAELEERLGESRAERERLLERSEALQKEWTEANRYQEISAKREHYEHILKKCTEQKADVDAALEFFGGKAPEADRLQKVTRDRAAMIAQETEMQANALDGEEQAELARTGERFAGGLPEDELFPRARKLAEELENLRAEEAKNALSPEEQREMEQLQGLSGAGTGQTKERPDSGKLRMETIEHYLDRWNLRTEKKSGLGTKKATLASLRALEEGAEKTRKKSGGIWLFVLAGALLAAGAVLVLTWLAVGVSLLAAGVLTLAAAFVLRAKGARKEKEKEAAQTQSGAALLEREIEQDEIAVRQATDEVMQFLDGLGIVCGEEDRVVRDVLYELKDKVRRLQRLEARREDYEQKRYGERIGQIKEEIGRLLSPYCGASELEVTRVYDLLSDLERQKETHIRLTGKEKKYRQAQEEYGKSRMSVIEFLMERGRENEADIDVYLQYLTKRLAAYEADLKDLAESEREKHAFEQRYDVSAFAENTEKKPRDPELIEQEQREQKERMRAVEDSIRSYVAQMDERQSEMEELEAVSERLAQLEERYQNDSAYYHHIELVSEYLTRAKESFSAKYMGPIMEAYRKYYGLIAGASGEEFRMDANIRLTRREEGEQRDTRSFSAGQQDLMGIALRMALIDAMYQKEKPFLIFDDSFTNLDDESLERAKAFLREVAKEYQVIYFTCSGSRAE